MNGHHLALRLGRSVVAIVVGYAVFVLGASVVQEGLLGGVSFHDSLSTLILAGLLTPLSAVVGGLLTAGLAGTRPFLHIIPMCVLVSMETTYLYTTGRVDGPLWFEAIAGASLIAGAIVGAWVWRQRRQSRPGSRASA